MKKQFSFRPIYIAVLLVPICLIFIIEAFSAKHLNYVFDFVGYGGTFKNTNLKILKIPAYWFMMLFGLLICLYTSSVQKYKYGFGRVRAILIPLAFLIVSFAGAKALYILENFKSVMQNGVSLGGLSLFGAIFAVPFAIWIASKLMKTEFAILSDFCTPFGLILLSCVRSGCFLNGCCSASTIWLDTKPIILPIQLIEVILDLIILEICLYTEKNRFKSGLMYPTFMICYGFVRFFIEFLRKSQDILWFFSLAQLLSLLSIALGFVLYLLNNAKKTKISKSW